MMSNTPLKFHMCWLKPILHQDASDLELSQIIIEFHQLEMKTT